MIAQFLEHLADCMDKSPGDKRYSMPINVLRNAEAVAASTSLELTGSFGGDASGVAWSVLCHRRREMMMIPMPPQLQLAIKASSQATTPEQRKACFFMISLAEHMILAMALLQWGELWQEAGYSSVFYHSDNTNSCSWTRSGFAGNDIAQELTRLAAVMQAMFQLFVIPMWVPTLSNKLADLISRMVNERGNTVVTTRSEIAVLNAQLTSPYQWVTPCTGVHSLVSWFSAARSANDVLRALEWSALRASSRLMDLCGTATGALSEQLRQWREAFTVQDAMHACREPACRSLTMASYGSGALVGLMGTLRCKVYRPAYAVEACPFRRHMWECVTGTHCFSSVVTLLNAVQQQPALLKLLYADLVVVTMPCEDYTRRGSRAGEVGSTGHLWPLAVMLALRVRARAIFSEMTDYATKIHGGHTLKRIVNMLESDYVVSWKKQSVWELGDNSNRVRLVLVAIRKDVLGAVHFRWPTPVFFKDGPGAGGPVARDTASPDKDVPSFLRYTEPIKTHYKWRAPRPGTLHKLGRLNAGMGLSLNPHLVLTFEGTYNTGTRLGGGGTYPPLDWKWGEPLKWRRKPPVQDWYMAASASSTLMQFHQQYYKMQCEDLGALHSPEHEHLYLLNCVNQGWPVRSAYAMDSAIASCLLKGADHREQTRFVYDVTGEDVRLFVGVAQHAAQCMSLPCRQLWQSLFRTSDWRADEQADAPLQAVSGWYSLEAAPSVILQPRKRSTRKII